MPRTRRRGPAQAGELPGTLKRSSKEAQETFTKAHDSAVQAYGEGDEADRATYAEFKRKFEKRGDHWIPRPGAHPGDLVPRQIGFACLLAFHVPRVRQCSCAMPRPAVGAASPPPARRPGRLQVCGHPGPNHDDVTSWWS